VSKASFSPACGGEGVYFLGERCLYLFQKELGDPVACFDFEGELSLVGQGDPDLSSVVRVHYSCDHIDRVFDC
jgi:hypothetical protein